MKNNLRIVVIAMFLLLETSTLIGQLSFDSFANSIGGFSSFSRNSYLYISDNNNTFSIRKKSDFKFSYHHSIDATLETKIPDYYSTLPISFYVAPPTLLGSISSFNIGYSPLPHLYGTANVIFTNLPDDNNFAINLDMFYGDIGIGGYFLKEFNNVFKSKNIFNRNSKWMMPQKGLLINALLGYGRGEISQELNWRTGYGEFTLNKFYGQIGIDYQARWWGIASSLKVGIINYDKSYIEGHAVTEFSKPIEMLAEKKNYNFSELNFRFYVGMKYGQVYLSGIKTKSTNIEEYTLSDYWNVGAVLNIQEFFRKEK